MIKGRAQIVAVVFKVEFLTVKISLVGFASNQHLQSGKSKIQFRV